jgi:DNA-binding SARP family transcriptional activator/class 3 adenylate cyclase/tetratricopeptide (TPR) repeat protein
MEFRILGPLEVHSNGQALDLGGAKQRALLAVLLLHANQVVSQDRLIDALWEEDPPGSAHKALQVYVSSLRKLLGKERLQTKPSGYLLRIEDGELDLGRFRHLREEGRLAEALALWRGPPLADFAYQDFAQAEIVRLEDQRLACVEEQINRDLEAGRHAELTGELDALVAEHPLRERLSAQRMLALYRSGRQAEALDAYQETRRALVDELGIEPGRELRELHQAILNQDPGLELRPEQAPPATGEVHPALAAEAPPRGMLQREVRKTVTVLFVDVRIVSAQGRSVDPEALRRVTGRAVDLVRGAVERHGGVFEMLAGAALTIVFGLPTVHEDDALRAVRAAIEVRDRLASLAAELEGDRVVALDCRIGIATGEVVAGGETESVGAIGEPLSRSSDLSRAADSGAIVVDDATRRLLREAVISEPVPGGGRVIELASAVGLPSRRLASPMVGRERERRRLRDAFDQAVSDRSCQLFTVLGLAGVGKSRLVQEFLAGVADQALVARGRCLPYGEGITFWPLLEVLKEAVGLGDGDSPETVRQRLSLVLGADSDDTARQIAELVGFGGATSVAGDGFAATQALVDALSRDRPLVLVFDDIHWGETTFLDLIEHLADSLRDSPVLLVCLARPELLDIRRRWGGGKVNATSVLLEPLSDAECGRLIENLVGGLELADEVSGRIADAAEGNPLFVEEMLSMLIEDGLLVRLNGQWSATTQLASAPVPPTIQALLAARLDQLGPDERTVIERAAIEGKVFHEGSVSELAPASVRASVGTHLEELVRKELIRPYRPDFGAEQAFRFRHLMIRDAAYDAIPKATRAELHEAFARWLEQMTGDRTTGYEEIIGYHLEQAFRYRTELGTVDDATRALAHEAAGRLGAAGSRAFVRRDAQAAVSLMSRAVVLMSPDDPARVNLIPNVRVVQGLSGDLSWAERVLTEAVETAAAAGDRRLEAHALVQLAFLRLFTQPNVEAAELHDVATRAISAFEDLGDELGLARAWRLDAQAHYLARRAGLCAAASTRALGHARAAGDQLEKRETVEWLCVALWLGPAPASEVAARCETLLEEVQRDPILEPIVLAVLGNARAMQGQMEEARELLDRWRRAVTEFGDPVWLFAINFGWVMLADDPAAAEQELRPGYEALRRRGEKSHFSSLAGLLARAVCAQGRYDEAERLTGESKEAARPNDIHSHILWRTTRAQVLAHKGDLESAEALAAEAVGFAAKSDFLDSHADALMVLAELRMQAGHKEDAVAHAREAIRLYEQKENRLSAERARSRLRAIEQG